MDKKLIILFVVFFTSILAIGSVSAVNLSNRDFDGYFSMDVPKGATFQKDINITDEDGIKNIYAEYTNDNIAIYYSDSPAFSENSSAWFFQTMFEVVNPDLSKCYESQEDNLRILEPTANNHLTFSIVGTSEGNKIIMVFGQDLNLIKQMGHSIKFK